MTSIMLRLLVAVFVSAAVVIAQEGYYTLKVDVPYVSVDVSVQDPIGKTISDLSAGDFELYEDGIRQDIDYFRPVSTPYNVFLLFDRSGSTQHKWAFMQKAVAAFISTLRHQDQLAIGTFDYALEMQMNWTDSRLQAVRALPDLINPKSIGGTNLYDALDRALRNQFKKVGGRRALLVLTDGRDTSLYRELMMKNRLLDPSEDREFQRAFKAARDQRIPTYFIAFNTDRNLEPNTLGGDEYRNLQIIFRNSPIPRRYLDQVRVRMEQIAEVSGGRILYPESIEEIIPLYRQIGQELGTSYSLGYVSSNPSPNGSFHRIEIRPRESQLRLIQSRLGYYAR
jgi:Ca-activated chloride channel homolog